MERDFREAYGMSLRFLNCRFLSEGELRKKLAAREVVPEVADAVVDKLKEERFLDDLRLAGDVYRYYAHKEKYGHQYICNRLRLRQLPIPEDREPLNEYDIAAKLIAAKFSYGLADCRKAARFLQYRGFSGAVIREILDNYPGFNGDGEEQFLKD